MWGPLYIEEKLHEFRQEDLTRKAGLGIAIREASMRPSASRSGRGSRALAGKFGALLVGLGSRLQSWATPGLAAE